MENDRKATCVPCIYIPSTLIIAGVKEVTSSFESCWHLYALLDFRSAFVSAVAFLGKMELVDAAYSLCF